MIKMIATDIDGTILKWEFGGFTPKVKECIQKLNKNGIKVVLVTGRMHNSAKFLAEELGIDTPIASYQGGMVVDKGEKLYEKYLDNDYAKKIIEWGKKENIHLNLYMDDILYVEQDNETIRRYTDARFIQFEVKPFDSLKIDKVNKILAIDYKNPDKVTSWVEHLKKQYPELYIVKSTPHFCEISNNEARKSTAVEFLCKKWGLKKEEVMTIGDQDNDIELLKAGGISVAMGNGTPQLKECADFITDSVENDGFVKAVEKFIIFQE